MLALKIQRIVEIDAPDLAVWIKDAVEASDKSVTAIAGQAGMSVGYLYRLMKGEQPVISEDKLKGLETALDKKYPGLKSDS